MIDKAKNNTARLLFTHAIMLISRVATKIFLSAYILKITGNIGDVAGYFLTYYTVATLVFIIAGPFCSKSNGLLIYRIGFAANLVFFLSLVLVGQHIGNYIVPVGILYGIANGLYWLPYNIMKYEHNLNETRKSYFSYERILEDAITVAVPVVAGFSIFQSGSYLILFGSMAILFLLAYFLSATLGWSKEKNVDYNLMHYIRLMQENVELMRVYKATFLSGFSFFGALDVLVTLLLFITLGNELSLGIAASILPILKIASSLCIAYFVKPRNYRIAVWLGVLLLVVSVSFLLVGSGKVNVIAYAVGFAIAIPVLSIMQLTYSFNIIDEDDKLKASKVEHFVVREVFINAGRVLSFLPLVALTGVKIDATWVKVVLAILALASVFFALYTQRVKTNS